MVSSEFGSPKEFFTGFDPSKVASDYGSKLYVWNWKEHTLRQTIDLGGCSMGTVDAVGCDEDARGRGTTS